MPPGLRSTARSRIRPIIDLWRPRIAVIIAAQQRAKTKQAPDSRAYNIGLRPPMGLAAFSAEPTRSRGRLYEEPPSPGRTDFQRDRDRIIHSMAFRRLKDKTQVFLFDEGDHYRTRLTHTIEVTQIARALARALDLNEDLA